jgi:predicted ATPase
MRGRAPGGLRSGSVEEPFIQSLELDRARIADETVYPFSIPSLARLEVLDLHAQVTFLTGANAAGKSTLIEAIAVAAGLNPEGGSRNFRFETRASHSPLGDLLRLTRSGRQPKTDFFLRAESYFNLATEIEMLDQSPFGRRIIDSFGGVPLHEQSHGQSFMALLVHRLGPEGLYVFDEPESALSPQGQIAMLARMHDLVGQGCQFMIATHSPILLSFPHARIYELSDEGIDTVEYDDSETVTLYRSFLAAPERYHRRLVQEGD